MLLLSLALELYYDPGAVAERAALVDAGLDLARRLGRPGAARRGPAGLPGWRLWSPSHITTRLELDEEALAAARAAGDLAAQAVALLALATDRLELSGPGAWEKPARAAEAIARTRTAAVRALDGELGRDEPRRPPRRPGRGRSAARPRARARRGGGPADRRHPAGHRRHNPPRLGTPTGGRRGGGADRRPGPACTRVPAPDCGHGAARPGRRPGGAAPQHGRPPADARPLETWATVMLGVLRGRGRERRGRRGGRPAVGAGPRTDDRPVGARGRLDGVRPRRRVPRPGLGHDR